MTRSGRIAAVVAVVAVTGACAEDRPPAADAPVPDTVTVPATVPVTVTVPDTVPDTVTIPDTETDTVTVTVDTDRGIGPISPLIRGLSGGVDREFLRDVGASVNSWGGNPSTRFNYEIGHAWNAGADWEYRNGNYGQNGDAARDFIAESRAGGAVVRLAVPTLGWVARNDKTDTCSFAAPSGCDGGNGLTCQDPGAIADPAVANVPSTPAMVQAWVGRLIEGGQTLEYVAMDNEPELWGHTHYDVHPACPTYEEILDKYLTYADAIRDVAPDAKLLGPVACCWYDFWGTAPGSEDDRDADYLTWFLEQVRQHDEQTGGRALDVLDVHYYPQSDVYNDKTDPDTSARRLRSTRSLWDPTYVDESWVDTVIRFIPRMHDTIAAAYPGTGLAVSEWNFGADDTMNGALAIADVLGIYGREGVELASYWQHPPAGSPGYYAFKMHGNYDGRGSSFEGLAVETTTSDRDRVGAYAAIDDARGLLRVMLLNKSPDHAISVPLSVDGAALDGPANRYQYSADDPTTIVHDALTADGGPLLLELPAYSITVVQLTLAS